MRCYVTSLRCVLFGRWHLSAAAKVLHDLKKRLPMLVVPLLGMTHQEVNHLSQLSIGG